jgi:hypothetical protein
MAPGRRRRICDDHRSTVQPASKDVDLHPRSIDALQATMQHEGTVDNKLLYPAILNGLKDDEPPRRSGI